MSGWTGWGRDVGATCRRFKPNSRVWKMELRYSKIIVRWVVAWICWLAGWADGYIYSGLDEVARHRLDVEPSRIQNMRLGVGIMRSWSHRYGLPAQSQAERACDRTGWHDADQAREEAKNTYTTKDKQVIWADRSRLKTERVESAVVNNEEDRNWLLDGKKQRGHR